MKYAIAKRDGSFAFMSTMPGIDPAGEVDGWPDQHKALLVWPLDIREVSEWVQEAPTRPPVEVIAAENPDMREAVIGLASVAGIERQRSDEMEQRIASLEATIEALRGAV